MISQGNRSLAAKYAEGRAWPTVVEMIKAAIAAQGSANAGQLIAPFGHDLLALVRPREILGRLPGVRRVPFDLQLVSLEGAVASAWVGEGQPIPISKPQFAAAVTLPRLKVASMTVMSLELARAEGANAESAFSAEISRSLVSGSDAAFIDPSNAGSSSKPAAVTNGQAAFAISGQTVTAIDNDLQRMIDHLVDNGSTLEAAAFVMHPGTAAFLARVRGTGGEAAYPKITAKGGELVGVPVLTSGAVPRVGSPLAGSISLVDGSRVWAADEGEVEFDVATHASIQMLDNPTNASSDGTATTMVSMYQTRAAALRGTRTINWKAAPYSAAVLTVDY